MGFFGNNEKDNDSQPQGAGIAAQPPVPGTDSGQQGDGNVSPTQGSEGQGDQNTGEQVQDQERVQEQTQVEETPRPVKFEGKVVSHVLEDDKHLRDADGNVTSYHVAFEDLTTGHVPAKLIPESMVPESVSGQEGNE